MTDRQYQLLFLHYFPGLTVEQVQNLPYDWWTFGCALIDRWTAG